MPEALAGGGDFLTITDSAKQHILELFVTKPKGAFRIRCEPGPETTLFLFDWDTGYTEDDFEFPCGAASVVMDALSIAYILDDYVLDHVFGKFTLEKRSQNAV